MKTIIVGFGNQGKKRKKILLKDYTASVDPISKQADYKYIKEVPVSIYDSALVCVPDKEKFEVIKYCLINKKNVLVEKPLFFNDLNKIKLLQNLANKNKTVLYTAYNHRFEPHFQRLKKLLTSKKLGKIYSCRLFYGNGTARLVRKSSWRDSGMGVLTDLGSHLLDTYNYWFNKRDNFKLITKNHFENKSPDHVIMMSKKKNPFIQFEMTLCMWRNFFSCDVLGKNGSAHIFSLCKWGPSKFIHRIRKLPSGKPIQKKIILIKKDPTWGLEYKYFKSLVKKYKKCNLENDIWINKQILQLSKNK